MDTAQWPQEIVVKPIDEIVTRPTAAMTAGESVERKTRGVKEQALNCPRCNSTNTKFCYYNNYSLTQPRYFCKTCRRYWTEGGSLRNIPVGGGSRKNKRSSSSSSSPSSPFKKHLLVDRLQPQPPLVPSGPNPKITTSHDGKGLNLAEAKDLNLVAFSHGFVSKQDSASGFVESKNPLVSSSALEFLGISSSSSSSSSVSSSSCSTFMALPTAHDPSVYAVASSGFGLSYPSLQEFMRPAMGYSLDTHDTLRQKEGSRATTTSERVLFPFENLKLPDSSLSSNGGGENGVDDHHHHHGGSSDEVGFWSGMLNGGASSCSWQWQL